jgi:hypothetical protein
MGTKLWVAAAKQDLRTFENEFSPPQIGFENGQERILTKAEGQRTEKPLKEGALRRIGGILDWREQIR